MKVSDIVVGRDFIKKLAAKEMHPEAALEFAAFGRDVMAVINEFESKRVKYFEKYGEKVDEKGNWKIKEGNENKFKAAVNRSLNMEVDIEPFNLTNSGVLVTPAELINVLSLFK